MTLRNVLYIDAKGAEEKLLQVTWKGRRGGGFSGGGGGGILLIYFCSNASLGAVPVPVPLPDCRLRLGTCEHGTSASPDILTADALYRTCLRVCGVVWEYDCECDVWCVCVGVVVVGGG